MLSPEFEVFLGWRKKYISFDCARISLGVVVMSTVDYPTQYMQCISVRHGPQFISQYVNAHRKVEYIDVWNVNRPGIDKGDLSQTAAELKRRLTILTAQHHITHMIYEFQMNANDKSRAIGRFLLYHFAGTNIPIISIRAARKNLITLREDLDCRNFFERYSTGYKARKEHSAASMIAWCKLFGIDISHIAKKNHDDAGDALMQILAHLY